MLLLILSYFLRVSPILGCSGCFLFHARLHSQFWQIAKPNLRTIFSVNEEYRPSLLLLLHFTSFAMLTLECFHRSLAWMKEHLRFKAFFALLFLQDCYCTWQSCRLTMEFHFSWYYTNTTMTSFQFEMAVRWWHRICTLNVMSFTFVLFHFFRWLNCSNSNDEKKYNMSKWWMNLDHIVFTVLHRWPPSSFVSFRNRKPLTRMWTSKFFGEFTMLLRYKKNRQNENGKKWYQTERRWKLLKDQIRERKIDRAHSLKIHHDCGAVECSFREKSWKKKLMAIMEKKKCQKPTNSTQKNMNDDEKKVIWRTLAKNFDEENIERTFEIEF